MRWARYILIALITFVLLIGAGIALLLSTDLSRFKDDVEDYVSEATGRQFVINGQFQPTLGKRIDLLIEDASLANADWGVAEKMLAVERLKVSVDLWSLIDGPAWIENLEIDGLRVHIETKGETGQSAWDFSSATQRDAPDDDARGFLATGELPVLLQQARLRDVEITYGQGWLDAPRTITVADATLLEGADELLDLALSGALGGYELGAGGQLGPLNALITGRDVRWELEVQLGQFRSTTQGRFRNLFALDGPDIQAQTQGPLAEALLERLGLPSIARGPVDISGSVREVQDGIQVRVAGAFGDLTTDITGRADTLRTIRESTLALDIRGRNAQAVAELFGAGFLPPDPFVLTGSISTNDTALVLDAVTAEVGETRLVIDGDIGLAQRRKEAQLAIVAKGPEIQRFIGPALNVSAPSGQFDVMANLAGNTDELSLQKMIATVGPHAVAADGRIGTLPELTGLDLNVEASGPDLDGIIGPWVNNDLPAGKYELSGRVRRTAAGYALDNISAAVGNARLKLSGTTGTLPGLDGLDTTVTFSGPDLQALVAPWTEIALPAEPFDVSGAIKHTQAGWLADPLMIKVGNTSLEVSGTAGSLPGLGGLDATVALSGPDLRALAAPWTEIALPPEPFEASGRIKHSDSGWLAEPLTIEVGKDRVQVRGSLGTGDKLEDIDLAVTASGSDLRKFFPDKDIAQPLPYTASGQVSIGENLIDAKEVEVQVGTTSGFVNGRIPTTLELADAKFEVRLSGPDLGDVGRTLNIQSLPEGPFRFDGALSRQGSAYVVNRLVAELGDNNVAGNLTIEFQPRRKLTGRLESDHLDLADLIPSRDESATQDDEQSDDERLIPDLALPLTLLDVADLDLIIVARRLTTALYDVGDVEMLLNAEDNRLSIETGDVVLKHGGNMSFALDMSRLNDTAADVGLNIVGKQFKMRPPIDDEGKPISRPAMNMNVELSGSGSTLRDVAASANGSISFSQDEGELDNTASGLILRDFASQLLGAINPFAKESPHTNLQCGIYEIEVVDGIARTRVIGLQTDRLSTASIGTLDLSTEALDLSFRTKQREGVGISVAAVANPYIKLGGTLAKPALKLDAKRGLVSGTVAVLTSGLSILAQGVWDRYLSADNFCEAVSEGLESGEIGVWESQTKKIKDIFSR